MKAFLKVSWMSENKWMFLELSTSELEINFLLLKETVKGVVYQLFFSLHIYFEVKCAKTVHVTIVAAWEKGKQFPF